MKTRNEKDYLGNVKVPADMYWGAQTQRAINNFPISGLRLQPNFIRAYAIIKKSSAIANMSLGKLDRKIGTAIVKACNEIISGKLRENFILDVYQAGAGTSTNMNLNEVIANRAIEILKGKKGNYKIVHPNNHVNMSQSTNDTFHSAMHMAAYIAISEELLPALFEYEKVIKKKSSEFSTIIKSGRTHLMDAVPLTLGQEFNGFSIGKQITTLQDMLKYLRVLGLGGTAVGTGLNAHPKFANLAVREINKETGYKFQIGQNLFAFIQNFTGETDISSNLKTLSLKFIKVANDIRLLSSGPVTGLNEIILPQVQPGSSIMPGKVNPSIPEMLDMVCFQVVGNDLTISLAAQAGQLELNVMMPVVAYNLLNSIEILSNGLRIFTEKCLKGIKANKEKIKENLEKNPMIVTAITSIIGYEKAAEVARRAYKENKTVKQVLLEMKLISKKEVDRILNYKKLVKKN